MEKFTFLAKCLREGTRKIDNYTYESWLYFDNGEEAASFLNMKADQTNNIWREYEQSIEMLSHGVEDEVTMNENNWGNEDDVN